MDSHTHQKNIVARIFPIGLLMGFSIALPAYITSTFLSEFVGQKSVGILYAVASAISIIIFALLPSLLRKFGNFKLTISVIAGAFLSLIAMAIIKSAIIIPVLFVFYFLYTAIIILNLDIFVEHDSENQMTGSIRGAYLVFINISWILSQVIVGWLLSENEYWKVFLVSALVLIPMTFFIVKRFKNFSDNDYAGVSYKSAWLGIINDKNLLGVFSANFLLQFFYSWMVIYTPIYLYEYLQFSWQEIGLIFGVMLLPFVITQYPLGKLADKKLGEKELLIAGFIIIIITTGIMSFITVKSVILWMIILFISRIGASTVEIMTETYFFKKTNDADAGYLAIFRTAKPWAYIIAPLTATTILLFIGIQYLFLILAIIMIAGAISSSVIKDTN